MKMWKFHSSGMQMIYAQYQLGNKKLIAFLKVHKRLILTSFLMGVIWIAIESSTSSWLTYTIPIYIFSTTPILILWRYVESDLKNLHSLIRFGNILFCSQIEISISTFLVASSACRLEATLDMFFIFFFRKFDRSPNVQIWKFWAYCYHFVTKMYK